MLHRNAEELISLSERIFVGICVSVKEQQLDFSNGSPLIYTEYTFQVLQSIKNVSSEKVVLRQIGSWRFFLSQNYPNPFNPETKIQYGLSAGSEVKISIYNLRGQQILALYQGEQGAGRHDVIWNGRNGEGVEAASGVYLVRMETGEFVLVRKMVLAR